MGNISKLTHSLQAREQADGRICVVKESKVDSLERDQVCNKGARHNSLFAFCFQLDSGPIVVPAIRVCQKADPHVHQQPWGFGDRRSGHLRHHAVRPTSHFNLVRRTSCFHGVTTLGCRISRNETLTAKCKNVSFPSNYYYTHYDI